MTQSLEEFEADLCEKCIWCDGVGEHTYDVYVYGEWAREQTEACQYCRGSGLQRDWAMPRPTRAILMTSITFNGDEVTESPEALCDE